MTKYKVQLLHVPPPQVVEMLIIPYPYAQEISLTTRAGRQQSPSGLALIHHCGCVLFLLGYVIVKLP